MKLSEMSLEEAKLFKKQLNLPVKKPLIYQKQIEYMKFKTYVVDDKVIPLSFNRKTANTNRSSIRLMKSTMPILKLSAKQPIF